MRINSFMQDHGLTDPPSSSETAHWFHEQLCTALRGEATEVPIYRTVHSFRGPGTTGDCAMVLVVDYKRVHAVRADIVAGRWRLKEIGRWDAAEELSGPDTCEQYFDAVVRGVRPYINRSFRIGLCLPFPLETTEDGVTVARPAAGTRLSKAIDGADPAQELLSALQRAGTTVQPTVRAVCPSVALLFAGSVLPGVTPDTSAALVLGNGGQVAYIEQGELPGPLVAVTASLDDLAEACLDPLAAQDDPPARTIGSAVRRHARAACDYGCFTPATSRQLRSLKTLSTTGLCSWLETTPQDPSMDEISFRTLAEYLLHRTERYAAAFAGSALRRATRGNRDRTVFLLVEGTAFSSSRLLRDTLRQELDALDPQYRAPSFCLAQVGDGVVVGTACAALQRMPADIATKKSRERDASQDA